MISNFFMPTRIVIGKDCISSSRDLFRELGKKALIVTGANSAKRNGAEKDVITALEASGISYVCYDRVMSNPTVACAYEGAELAKENGVDFIIAIGGGSPMDAGKAIALLAAQHIEEENLFSGSYEKKVLPMAFVPTTAGTGSEVTQYSILTNDKEQTKTSIASELLFPAVAFLDHKYMENLSIRTTVNTAVDALSHAVEGMLSRKATFLSDALAQESIRIMMDCVPELVQAVKQSDTPVETVTLITSGVREKLLKASLLAGMVIAQTGTTAVHAMGYSLTYFKDIDHGRANGLLLAGYLRLVEKVQPELARRIMNLMGLSSPDKFCELTVHLLGAKEKLSGEEIKRFSSIAIKTKNISNCIVKPTEEDIIDIYSKSLA